MTTSSWTRARRVTAVASVLTVFAVVVGAVILALRAAVPDGWWPDTGQAFAADNRAAHQDPCALIVGPGRAYCERGTTTTAAAEQQDVAGAAWKLVAAGAGFTALAVWRLQPAGQRRR